MLTDIMTCLFFAHKEIRNWIRNKNSGLRLFTPLSLPHETSVIILFKNGLFNMCVSKVSLKLIQESHRSYQLCSSDSAGSCCAHMSLCRSCYKRAHDSDWLHLCLRLKCSWLDRVAFSFLLFALICNFKAPTTEVDAEGGCDWVDTSKMDWCSVWSRTKCLRNKSGSTKLFPTFLWIFFFLYFIVWAWAQH